MASWIVPCGSREDWRGKWDNEVRQWWAFLTERDEVNREARLKLVKYCWSAFEDAFWRRFDKETFYLRLRGFIHGPAFCLLAIAALWLVLAVGSHGCSRTRMLLGGLPYSRPEQLVTLSQKVRGVGLQIGVPASTFRLWLRQNKRLNGLAAFYLRSARLARPSARPEGIREVMPQSRGPWDKLQLVPGGIGKGSGQAEGLSHTAGRAVVPETEALLREGRVTPEFFSVLGVQAILGRTFQPQDASGEQPCVVLSYDSWRSTFHADPAIVGRQITLDGQPARVVGVLPRSLWFASPQVKVWTVLSLSPQSPARIPGLLAGVARLPPGVPKEQAQAELRAIATHNRTYWNGAQVELASLQDGIRKPLSLYGIGVLLSLGAGLLAALIQGRRLWLSRNARASRRYTWRYWLFFLGKICLAVAALAGFWLELVTPALNPVDELGLGVLLSWVFFLGCAIVLFFSLRDQRQRCPVCLRRLAMPVRIGSWGSPLLDPVSTELLCEKGHGALHVPEVQSSASEPERWTVLDDSWQELFSTRKR